MYESTNQRSGVQLRQQFIIGESTTEFVVTLGGGAGFVYSSIRLFAIPPLMRGNCYRIYRADQRRDPARNSPRSKKGLHERDLHLPRPLHPASPSRRPSHAPRIRTIAGGQV